MNIILEYIIIFIGLFCIINIALKCKINLKTIFSVFIIAIFELYFIEVRLLHLYLNYNQLQKEILEFLLKLSIQINSFSNNIDNIIEVFALIIVFLNGKKLCRQLVMKVK